MTTIETVKGATEAPDRSETVGRKGRLRGLSRTIGLRLSRLIIVIFGATFLAFLLLNLLPGDVTLAVLGDSAPDEARRALRAELGLDRPLHVRYLDWLGGAVTGDLGNSLSSGRPVTSLIGDRLPVTAQITAMSLVISLAISVPAAAVAARHRGRWPDQLLNLGAYGAIAAPPFLAGTVLIYIVSVQAGWLPASGWVPITEGLVDNLRTAIMPALALIPVEYAVLMRVLRADIVVQLAEDYPTAARAKGMTSRQVMVRHVMRNSSLPLVTFLGLQIGVLLGGTVIVESVFAVPGVGNLLVQSIHQRDVVTVQGIVVFLAVVFVVVNTLVDILYTVLDPRIRYGSTNA